MDDEVVVTLTRDESIFFSAFLSNAFAEIKNQCTVAEAENPEVRVIFALLGKVLSQLPEVK